MRNTISLLLAIVGGVLVSFQVWSGFAFMQGGRGILEQARFALTIAPVAAAVLIVAALLNGSDRWRWVGRALLFGAQAGALLALSIYASVPDPFALTWQVGLANYALVSALGYAFLRLPHNLAPV